MNQKQGKLSVRRRSKRFLIIPLAVLLFSGSSMFAQDLQYTLATPHLADWVAVGSSADGSVLAAYASSGGLYISTNSGAIWTQANPFLPGLTPPSVCSLVLTPDASTLVVVVGHAYVSHDLGVTWTTNSLPGNDVQKVTITDDGRKWVCADTGNFNALSAHPGGIYVSSDSGASWQLTGAPITNWTWVAASGDGNRLAAVHQDSQVYMSSDRGATWTTTTPAGSTNSFSVLVSSSDGNKLVAIEKVTNANGIIAHGIVCVSTNAGSDWITIGTAPPFSRQVAASADAGTIALIAASDASGNEIYTSTNSGAFWESRVPRVGEFAWDNLAQGVAVSGDGSRIVAGVLSGFVFTYPLPRPALSVSVLNYPPSQMTWRISWPSNQVDFVLESAPTLSPHATWTPVTNGIDPSAWPPITTNITYPGGYQHVIVVTNAVGGPSAFYRLHKP